MKKLKLFLVGALGALAVAGALAQSWTIFSGVRFTNNGTIDTPTISWNSDQNMGIWRGGADDLVLSVDGGSLESGYIEMTALDLFLSAGDVFMSAENEGAFTFQTTGIGEWNFINNTGGGGGEFEVNITDGAGEESIYFQRQDIIGIQTTSLINETLTSINLNSSVGNTVVTSGDTTLSVAQTNIDLDSAVISLVGMSGGLMINGQEGSSGQVLTSNGSGAAPTWQAAGGGGVTQTTGTWTTTFDNACTTSPTVTFDYVQTGDAVTAWSTAVSGFPCTGDVVGFSSTSASIPVGIRPASVAVRSGLLSTATDNGTSTYYNIVFNTSGTVTLEKCTSTAPCSSVGWTASGNRSMTAATAISWGLGNP